MIESALAVGFRTGWFSSCSFCVSSCCLSSSFSASDDLPVVFRSRPFNRKGISELDPLWKSSRSSRGFCFTSGYQHHRYSHHNVPTVRVRVASEYSDSESKDAPYHPFEEITERVLPEKSPESVKLSDAEMSRTIVEANSKATLMFSGAVGDEDHQSIFWPELSYITDEHGDIYFEVQNDEDILQSLSAENNSVHVIIGLNNLELLSELDLSGQTDIDFNIEEITEENNFDDDDDEEEDNGHKDEDYIEDWITILDDLDDGFDSSETLGDWANLETMRSSHPMYFASKISEVVSNLQLDWMDQPSSVVAIQGLLRPAFIEEQTIIREYISRNQSHGEQSRVDCKRQDEPDLNPETSSKDGATQGQEVRKNESHVNANSFYKLEMTKIQLVSAYGSQNLVKVEDFHQALPDIIAHSATKIMSNLKAGGEKTTQALKTLCWTHKGIQVQEATVVGVDSLGFDLKVCSGTQVQTLRFAFHTRATSKYSAERQLEEMLFPEE